MTLADGRQWRYYRSTMHTLTRLLIAVALLSPLPAVAHHGWAGYAEEEFDISGVTTTPVSLAGPHATFKIKVDEQVWDVTLAPPPRTSGAGLNATTIPVGAKVSIHGHRHKDPKRFEVKTERVTYNGKVYNVYPDRS
jgi:hypothetical protein